MRGRRRSASAQACERKEGSESIQASKKKKEARAHLRFPYEKGRGEKIYETMSNSYKVSSPGYGGHPQQQQGYSGYPSYAAGYSAAGHHEMTEYNGGHGRNGNNKNGSYNGGGGGGMVGTGNKVGGGYGSHQVRNVVTFHFNFITFL